MKSVYYDKEQNTINIVRDNSCYDLNRITKNRILQGLDWELHRESITEQEYTGIKEILNTIQ